MNCKHSRICRHKFCSWHTNSFCLQILPTNQLPLPEFIGRKLPVKIKDPVGLCPSVFWIVFSTLCLLFTFACQIFYVTECCSVVQCGAVCCSLQQSAVVCCSTLQCAAVCCSVLQYVAVFGSVLHCNTLQHTLQRSETQTLTPRIIEIATSLQHTTAHCNTEHTLQRPETQTLTPCNIETAK